MSDRKAYAIHTLQYKDGDNFIERPAGWVGHLPAKVFEDFEANKAVRKATKEDEGRATDRGLTEDSGETKPAAAPEQTPLVANHIGGGKWNVKRGDAIVSGDEKFDTKAAAETWATENANAGLTEDLLS